MAELKLRGAASIDAAALAALTRHAGPNSEPHLVAAIFRDNRFRQAIVDAVRPQWQAVAVRTVFVHLTPKVTFPCGRGACELGDALIVYRERLRADQRRRQAVLFQAKVWKGNDRDWVATDPDQHALYRHWPPFKVKGGPPHEIRLPPGDYGRVLGLVPSPAAADVPRVSPRRPTRPGCVRESEPWSETTGTLGRAIRGVLRFEIGERVVGEWASTVADMIKRVGPTPAGRTFAPGPRGGTTARQSIGTSLVGTSNDDPEDAVRELDALLDDASDLPPEDDVPFHDGDRPLSILLIDVEDVG